MIFLRVPSVRDVGVRCSKANQHTAKYLIKIMLLLCSRATLSSCRIQSVNETMVPFRSGLLTCLLASTSSAFAFKPVTHSTSFAQQHGTTINRSPINLSMSGGQVAVPDLKPPAAIYEGAVAAGAGACMQPHFRDHALI